MPPPSPKHSGSMLWNHRNVIYVVNVSILVLLVIFGLQNSLPSNHTHKHKLKEDDIDLLYELGKEMSSTIQKYNEYDSHSQILYWMGGTTSLAAARNIPPGFFRSDDTYHLYFPNDQLKALIAAFPEDHPTLTLEYLTELGYYKISSKSHEHISGNMYPVEWKPKIHAFGLIDNVVQVSSMHPFHLPDKNVTNYLTECKFYDFTFQCMKMEETEKYLSETFGKPDTIKTSVINANGLYNKNFTKSNDYYKLLPALTKNILNNMRDAKMDVNEKDGALRTIKNSIVRMNKNKWLKESEIDQVYDMGEQFSSTIKEYNKAHPDDPFIYWIGGGTSLAATRNTPPGVFQWDDDYDFNFVEASNSTLAKIFPSNHPTLKLIWMPKKYFYRVRLKANEKIFSDLFPVRWDDNISAYNFIDYAQRKFPKQHFYFPTTKPEDHLVTCPFYDFSFPCMKLDDRMRYLWESYSTKRIMTHIHMHNHMHLHGEYDLGRTKNFPFLQPALSKRIMKKMQALSYSD